MNQLIPRTFTAGDILNIFIEQHRLTAPLDPEADPDVKLSFDTTVEEWRSANNLLSWQPLSRFLNQEFQIVVSKKEWESVLTPPSDRTLQEVCEMISRHYRAEDISIVKLRGEVCIKATLFLTLKKYLRKRQAEVSEVKPSSLLSPYLENYFSEMIEQITILSRGRKIIDHIEIKRKKPGFWNYINIFDKERYTFSTGEVRTFRDLILKMAEVNNTALCKNNDHYAPES